jgi:CYTH domain-containing protein
MSTSPCKPVVVIADDDVIVRRTLGAELSQAGYTVVAYEDGLAALKHFALGERADVLVTDIHMPASLDGFFLATEVRDQRPNLPVVYLSSRTPCADRMVPGSRFVRKPTAVEEIRLTVDGSLEAGATCVGARSKVHLETERVFLVKNDRWKSEVARASRLRDRVLFQADGVKLRLRREDRRGVLTLKGPKVRCTRAEIDMVIPAGDCDAMMAIPWGGPPIEKIRYTVPYAGHAWEVDVYQGYLKGIVLVQVELDCEDTLFAVPPWVGQEVTGDPRFSQSALRDLSWAWV